MKLASGMTSALAMMAAIIPLVANVNAQDSQLLRNSLDSDNQDDSIVQAASPFDEIENRGLAMIDTSDLEDKVRFSSTIEAIEATEAEGTQAIQQGVSVKGEEASTRQLGGSSSCYNKCKKKVVKRKGKCSSGCKSKCRRECGKGYEGKYKKKDCIYTCREKKRGHDSYCDSHCKYYCKKYWKKYCHY